MKIFYLLVFFVGINDLATAQNYFDTGIPDSTVKQNAFIKTAPNTTPPPTFNIVRAKLPEPYWPARPDVIACYWRAWQLAFQNLHAVQKANGFISPYIDPAFNGHLFMWDTNFMLLFGQYGRNAFAFQNSLDNFYHTQHSDGYICREISEADGREIFAKQDPSSTGPNIMGWSEWEYFQNTGDTARLKAVFVPLLAHYRWFRDNRSWPDGSYFSTGWGCGMDNQPRVPKGFDPQFSPAFTSWVDITAQQVFAGKILLKMAKVLKQDIPDIQKENQTLITYLNDKMWDNKTAYYEDRFRDGSLSTVKSVASYWALLAEAVPQQKAAAFIAHLDNKNQFNRLHRVPALSADDPGFVPTGGYWKGGVWAPTTYMVLNGLSMYGKDSLTHEIALNDLNNVVQVYNESGKLWENYAPDKVQGNGVEDLVGWTGLVPITELFEYVFGIKADVPRQILHWDIRLTDAFGIRNYPYGKSGIINLKCAKRQKLTDKPRLMVSSTVPVMLEVSWNGGSELINVQPKE